MISLTSCLYLNTKIQINYYLIEDFETKMQAMLMEKLKKALNAKIEEFDKKSKELAAEPQKFE